MVKRADEAEPDTSSTESNYKCYICDDEGHLADCLHKQELLKAIR